MVKQFLTMKPDTKKNQVYKSGAEIALPISDIEEEINMIFEKQLEDSLDFLSKPARPSKQPRKRRKNNKAHPKSLHLNTHRSKKTSENKIKNKTKRSGYSGHNSALEGH